MATLFIDAFKTNFTLNGTAENDTLDALTGGGNNTLNGGDGDDYLYAYTNDKLYGEGGNDQLFSEGNGNNILDGGDGNDTFYPDRNDSVFGGAGDDVIYSGLGGNTITAGTGKDTFWLANAEYLDTPNIITDFNSTEDILLVSVGSFKEISQLTFTTQGNDTLVSAGDKQLAILQGVVLPTASEFSIAAASATEGNSITFTVTRIGDSQANQNVTVETSVAGGDTTEEDDFTPKTETLTFAQGETEKTFTVETAEDSRLEDNETFTVKLSSATNGATISPINGTAKGTINDDDIALVPIINNNIFTLRGIGETVRLKVTLISNNSNVVNELGIFYTDDNEGSIRRDDGTSIKPGQQGYREAALERAKNQGESVFSAIANLPDLFKTEIQTNNLTRILEFDSGTNLQFFLVKNGTIDGFRSGVISNSNVIFADFSTQNITQENNSYILSLKESNTIAEFNSLVVRIESTRDLVEIGTARKGEIQAEILDLTYLRDQGILTVKAIFSVFREATFDNEVYFYKVDNSEGKIGTLTATAANRADYLQAAINNIISNSANDGIIKFAVDNQNKFTDSATIATGSILVPMIIVDGTLSQLTDNITSNDPQVYFPYLGLNSDGADHIRLLGNNIFGFEDLPNGGDSDYNDIIIKMNFTQIV